VQDKFLEAQQILNDAAKKSDSCIVFYSGGKDSLVVMDLAARIFKRVFGVFMYFVPGLSVIEKQLEYARQRWGVEIVQVPHWILFRCIKHGFYALPSVRNEREIPDVKLKDIYQHVISTTGIPFIATGAKMADSVWRRQNLNSTAGYEFLLTPLKNWNKFDVLYYLKNHGIPVPDNEGGDATGIDLNRKVIFWLYDKHREDYDRMAVYFPFIGALIKQRELYGQARKAGTGKSQ
jgi:3'-phosphoadenosine 5'-phosphosulfate sulfotransferase (PAPS reductase)/FAD synthetase